MRNASPGDILVDSRACGAAYSRAKRPAYNPRQPAAKPKELCVNLTVANISTQVTDAALQAAIAAIGKQVSNEFQAEWGTTADLKGLTQPLPQPQAPIQGDPDAIIYL